jgi:DNA-binding response OmpR family regulator
VPKTLLAVDDSATMRKVLEITFAGEDFRVVSADGASGALSKLSEDPVAVVIDTSLVGDDGYALARDVRAKNTRAAVVLMASRYNPYDAARGRDAGVDDSIDKPFDTQVLIDKVKKAITARENARPAVVAQPPQPPPPPPPAQAPNVTAAMGGAARPAVPAAAAAPAPTAASSAKAWPNPRTHTLSFEGMPPTPPSVTIPSPLSRTAPSGITPPQPANVTVPVAPAPAAAPPAPVASSANAPTAAPAAHAVPTAAPAANAVPTAAPPRTAEAVNGQLAGKLDALGLTPQQVDAVLALSRELVERVVWEVVPPLAETLIKEEIARLTKEG